MCSRSPPIFFFECDILVTKITDSFFCAKHKNSYFVRFYQSNKYKKMFHINEYQTINVLCKLNLRVDKIH